MTVANGAVSADKPVAQCAGCGWLTNDRRAVICCSGLCLDPSGASCDAWPCPNCGKLHYWTCSFAPAERADGFYVRRRLDGTPDPICPIYKFHGRTAQLVASSIGAVNHTFEQGDHAFPRSLIRAGATLDGVLCRSRRMTRHLSDEVVRKSIEQYHPCATGIHVCGIHRDGPTDEYFQTVANFPFPDDASAADAFVAAGEECAAVDGEPTDLVVDLMSDGSIIEDFSMTRQMLDRLKAQLERALTS